MNTVRSVEAYTSYKKRASRCVVVIINIRFICGADVLLCFSRLTARKSLVSFQGSAASLKR